MRNIAKSVYIKLQINNPSLASAFSFLASDTSLQCSSHSVSHHVVTLMSAPLTLFMAGLDIQKGPSAFGTNG